MMDNSDGANDMTDVVSLGGALFSQTGKEIVAPRINSLIDKLERQYKLKVLPKKKHVEHYWRQEYKRLSIVNSVIFGNSQRELCRIYVPMSLLIEGDDVAVPINDYPQKLVNKYHRILIKDSLGMGKSTMLKRMFVDVIDNELGYPIYVELRNLSEEHTIVKEILKQLSSINEPFEEQLLLDLIEIGGFVFFLDGLDEIGLESRRCVVSDIQNFIAKSVNCQFVMTSREDDSLAGFGNFKGCSIVVMKSGDVTSLLLRYGENCKKVVELVEKIRRGEYKGIDDFLKNPLLAGLLYRAYVERANLDLKLYQLCCNIFPVFYEQHDQTKDGSYTHDIRSKLDASDMERLLMIMGFKCMALGKKEFSYDDFNQLILFASEQCGDLCVKVDNFREDITKSVPIFCKDGYMYRWVHYALCDYYAARFIYIEGKKNTPDILLRICQSEKIKDYLNVLKMYAEMDVNGFNRFVAKPLIDTYVAKGLKESTGKAAICNGSVSNTACIIELLYEVVPSIFMEKGVLDVDEAMRFSSTLSNVAIGNSIDDIIKGL